MAQDGPAVPTLPGTRAVFGGNGISGLSILAGIAGLVLVVSGLRNASIADTLRSLLRGQPIESGPSMLPRLAASGTPIGAGGSATGSAVASKAASYVGVPYSWAHHDPSGWDCSGFVTWVLHHDFGLDLPDNTHTVTGQFYIWNGAVTVPRAQTQPGDLVCWVSHIGIATSATDMVNAPGIGIATRVQPIYDVPAPIIRRPLAYGPKATKAAA